MRIVSLNENLKFEKRVAITPEIAKKYFGDDITIILGGKHAIETTFLIDNEISVNNNCSLKLMLNKEIPRVFDFVLSGDGEESIVQLVEAIGDQKSQNKKIDLNEVSNKILKANGDWLLGWLSETNEPCYLKSNNKEINYNKIKSPLELFGIDSNFDVFDSELTAHMYSYMGKGCPYNCFFCSERRDINGKLVGKDSAVDRLVGQLIKLQEYGLEHLGHTNVSAFIEDSILLGGGKKLLQELLDKLKEANLHIKFGAQFTLDTLLKNKEIIAELADYGLYYVFLGMETNDETIAKTMDKNTQKYSWKDRNEEVLTFLNEAKIKCGFSILFGLGETQEGRIKHLEQILTWQKELGSPHVISLNWATLHPLRNLDICNEHKFIDWGISGDHPDLDLLSQLFGEVSLTYCLPNTELPNRNDLLEILRVFNKVNHQNLNTSCLESVEISN